MNILFLCTGNACRSQMAEALAQQIYPQHHFYSAGVEIHGLNPLAVKVCHELGLDLSAHNSKHVSSLKSINFDLVITVCDHAQEQCPVYLTSVKTIHHSFLDPPKIAKQRNLSGDAELEIYRDVRDAIKNWLINELDLPNHELN
jgi:arsenate reductase